MELLLECTRRHFRIHKIPKLFWGSMPPDPPRCGGPSGPTNCPDYFNFYHVGRTGYFSFLRPCLMPHSLSAANHTAAATMPSYSRPWLQVGGAAQNGLGGLQPRKPPPPRSAPVMEWTKLWPFTVSVSVVLHSLNSCRTAMERQRWWEHVPTVI
jgi:hypothetical protein